MGKKKKKKNPFSQLWESGPAAMPKVRSRHALSSDSILHIRHWKADFCFLGPYDEALYNYTEKQFPAKVVPFKRRPVFSLDVLPDGIGAEICPCTTKPQRDFCRYIREGCRFRHTGRVNEKKSYLLEHIRIKISSYTAGHLIFLGEVPSDCILIAGGTHERK